MPKLQRSHVVLGLLAFGGVLAASMLGKVKTRRYGSQTNASDAVSAPVLGEEPSAERVLDVGVEYTFPASDPIAIQHAFETACDREARQSG